MSTNNKISVVLMALYAIAMSVMIWVGLSSPKGEKVPPPPILDLGNVTGPIEFISGGTSNHDGTWTFEFKDVQGVSREIEIPEGSGNVVLRPGDVSRVLPRTGAEEERLLALLEEWIRVDSEAKKCEEQIDIHWEVSGKEVGVAIARELRKRHPSK